MKTDIKLDNVPNISTLGITADILAVISELDEFKGAWSAIGRLAPERLAKLRRVATIESVGSSTRIEGAKLSDREVEALLSNLEIKEFKSRDEEEVAGYADVMETVFESWESIDPTENHIKQLHRDLLRHGSKDQRHRGAYKTLPNHVEAFGPDGESLGVVLETARPFETPAKIADLVTWARNALAEKTQHPLLLIAVFIAVFLAIHPFQDGNGRLSRILTTLLLLRAGYAYVPYSSLESVIEQSKEGYYLALRQTQGTIYKDAPDWQPWLIFSLKALQQQKRRLDKKIRRERIMLGALPELSVQILEIAREHGRVTVANAEKVTGANRNTIKVHLKTLTENAHLERHGAGRGAWYALAGAYMDSGEAKKRGQVFNVVRSRSEYIAMREKFRPNHLRLIFIAESPPKSGQYLYDTGGRTKENLFSALMKAMEFDPANKISGLQELQSRGLFLIDATYHPVNGLKGAARDQAITNDYAHLVSDLRQTPDVEHVPIVLIKANVCRLLEPMLMKDGFNVINNGGLVYFPACGHQQEFQEQLATILKRSKTEIRNKGSQYNKWS